MPDEGNEPLLRTISSASAKAGQQGVKILELLNERARLGLEFVQFDWGADTYLATGVSLPANALDGLRQNYAAVYLGPIGDARVPDMLHTRDTIPAHALFMARERGRVVARHSGVAPGTPAR